MSEQQEKVKHLVKKENKKEKMQQN